MTWLLTLESVDVAIDRLLSPFQDLFRRQHWAGGKFPLAPQMNIRGRLSEIAKVAHHCWAHRLIPAMAGICDDLAQRIQIYPQQ